MSEATATVQVQEQTQEPTAPSPELEPTTPEVPTLPKCEKCGRETQRWNLEETEEGLLCARCLKFPCRTCGKKKSKAKGAYKGFQCEDCQEKERVKKLKLNAVLEFRFESAKLFEKIFKAVSDIEDEPVIQITNEGIVIRTMDPSRVAMVDYFLSKRVFEEYHVFKEGFMQINIEEMLKHMKHLRNDTKIKVFVDGKDAKFTMTLIDSRERERTLNMFQIEKIEIPPYPKITFKAKVRMDSSAFYSDLDDMGNFTDNVSFESDYKNFLVKGLGDVVGGKNTYPEGSEGSPALAIDGNGDNRAKYSLSYLKILLRKDLSDVVLLEWDKDMPLKITHENVFPLDKDTKIVAYIAPRIEVD